MAKINYAGVRGAAKVRRKAHPAPPVADTEYRRLHEVIYREIQKRNCSYVAAAVRAANVHAIGI